MCFVIVVVVVVVAVVVGMELLLCSGEVGLCVHTRIRYTARLPCVGTTDSGKEPPQPGCQLRPGRRAETQPSPCLLGLRHLWRAKSSPFLTHAIRYPPSAICHPPHPRQTSNCHLHLPPSSVPFGRDYTIFYDSTQPVPSQAPALHAPVATEWFETMACRSSELQQAGIRSRQGIAEGGEWRSLRSDRQHDKPASTRPKVNSPARWTTRWPWLHIDTTVQSYARRQRGGSLAVGPGQSMTFLVQV